LRIVESFQEEARAVVDEMEQLLEEAACRAPRASWQPAREKEFLNIVGR
jgi:hypothetical protein